MSKDTVRLSVDCSLEERQKIKVISTLSGETMSSWIMDAVRERIKKEAKRLPNEKTRKALLESQKGKGVKRHGSIEELFDYLEI